MSILAQMKSAAKTGNVPENIIDDNLNNTPGTSVHPLNVFADSSYASPPSSVPATTPNRDSFDDAFFNVTADTTSQAEAPAKPADSTAQLTTDDIKITMTGSNLPFRSETHSVEVGKLSPAPKPANVEQNIRAQEKAQLAEHGAVGVWIETLNRNPECVEQCKITGGALGKPVDVFVMKVTEENPVLLGFKEGIPVTSTSGVLVKEPGDRISYMSEKEFSEKADEADEIKNKEGMRGGTVLSALLKMPIAAFKSAFNTGVDLAKSSYDKEHLSKFREQKLARTANSASMHLNRATESANYILKDEKIAPLVNQIDDMTRRAKTVAENGGNVVAVEEHRNNLIDKVRDTILTDPKLSEKLTESISETNLAARKHGKFLADAEKSNLSPDKLIQMDQIDSQSIEKLKKMLEKIGTPSDSKAMESLNKMVEDIRDSVKRMVDKFQSMFGAKNG